jgi:hypothetical protein
LWDANTPPPTPLDQQHAVAAAERDRGGGRGLAVQAGAALEGRHQRQVAVVDPHRRLAEAAADEVAVDDRQRAVVGPRPSTLRRSRG